MRKMFSKKQLQLLSIESVKKAMEDGSLPVYEEIDIEDYLTFDNGGITAISCELGYCKIRRTLTENLYIILNFKIKNESASNQSLGNYLFFELELPEEIASLIYDANGKTAKEAVGTESGISADMGFSDNGYPTVGYNQSRVVSLVNINKANTIRIHLRDMSTIDANDTWGMSFRTFLSL